MLVVTTYRLKPFATKAERVRVMELFAEHGTPPGVIGHYISADATTGWVIGDALPYLFGGLAVGRVDVARAVTVSFDKFDDFDTTTTVAGVTTTTHSTVFLGSGSQSSQERRSNSFVAGWVAGLGMEYCLWGNMFMRGEWEYVRFLSVKDISFSTNNLRVGIGYKF